MKLLTKLAVSFGVSVLMGTTVVAAPTIPTLPAIQEMRPSVTEENSTPATPAVKDQEIENKINTLAKCETTHNPTLVNWNDGGSPSFGLLQFKLNTLLWRSRELHMDRVFTAEQNQRTVSMVEELKTIEYGSRLPIETAQRLAAIEREIAYHILVKDPYNVREWTNCANKHGLWP